MKKFKIIALGMATALALGVGGVAFAQPCPQFSDQAGWYRPDVELSKEQTALLDEALVKHRTAVEPLRQQMIIKRAELQSQMIAQKPDTAKVEALSREIGEIKGKLASESIRFHAELEKQGLPVMRHHDYNGFGCKGGGHGGHGGYNGNNTSWRSGHGNGHGNGYSGPHGPHGN